MLVIRVLMGPDVRRSVASKMSYAANADRTGLAQNQMRAKGGLPVTACLNEGLDRILAPTPEHLD